MWSQTVFLHGSLTEIQLWLQAPFASLETADRNYLFSQLRCVSFHLCRRCEKELLGLAPSSFFFPPIMQHADRSVAVALWWNDLSDWVSYRWRNNVRYNNLRSTRFFSVMRVFGKLLNEGEQMIAMYWPKQSPLFNPSSVLFLPLSSHSLLYFSCLVYSSFTEPIFTRLPRGHIQIQSCNWVSPSRPNCLALCSHHALHVESNMLLWCVIGMNQAPICVLSSC